MGNLKKYRENLKNLVELKKRSLIRNFGRENGIFFLKRCHSEILVCEIFVRPP